MKKFIVSCNYLQHFTFAVEAESEEEALEAAYDKLEEDGVPENANIFERDFDAVFAEEVEY